MTTITASQEQQIVDQVPKQLYIAGEWRDGAKGTLDRRGSVHRGGAVRGRRRVRRRRHGRAWTPRSTPALSSPRWRRASVERSCAARSRRSSTARTSWPLLMTLEMGKTVRESLAEIAYAAEFFRWFSEEAVRIDGRYAVAANGAGRVLTMKQPRRSVPDDHPVELPARDGHAQDRPGDRRGLHDGRQARAADAAVDAGAGEDPRGGRPPGRRPQPVHRVVVVDDDRSADRRPAVAQDVVHRLDRGRAQADGAGVGDAAAAVDGARRQRAVRRLRRRRRRRGRRRRDAGEDAQHGRGVHLGQPLPRRRLGRRGVRREAGREDGRAQARTRGRRRDATSGR